MRRVLQRRRASNANSNNTNKGSFEEFVLRMDHNEFDLSQNVAMKCLFLMKTIGEYIYYFKGSFSFYLIASLKCKFGYKNQES